jgi:inorganic triphosphatase YgiF
MEIEFKFQVPADRLAALKAELRSAPTRRTRLRARYFDTADGSLAAQGAVLRLRQEGDRWVQTAKALGEGPLHRLEHNADLGPARAGEMPEPDVRRHAGTPVGERIAHHLEAAGQPLVETYGTDIWRLSREVHVPAPDGGAGTTVELALDLGHVVATPAAGGAARRAPVCELELELVDGDIAGLVELARHWSQAHGLWLSTVSKAERGERLMAGLDAAPAVKARPPRFEAVEPAPREDAGKKAGRKGKGKGVRKGSHRHGRNAPDGPAIQRAVVAACLAQMLPNASEIAAGDATADVVHQLRVGIRRLRTALRELDVLGPGFDPAWEPPLVLAFRGLGARRDQELRAEKLAPRLDAAGAPSATVESVTGDTPAPGDLVRDPAFQAVLVDLIGFAAIDAPAAAAPSDDTGEHAEPGQPLDAPEARHALQRRLRKLHRRLVEDADRFDTLEIEARHDVRKKLKRLRYLAEFVAPLFDTEGARRYLAHLAPAQDALGEANDEASALEAFRGATATDPRAWFAVGWLSARQEASTRASQKALRRIAKAPRFWKRQG